MMLDKSKDLDSIGYYLSEHLRIGGGYWTINALACIKEEIPDIKKLELRRWLLSCQNSDGGFGGNTKHDSHITNTHYGVLLGILLDCKINREAAAKYIAHL